jgi:hypothetical protein
VPLIVVSRQPGHANPNLTAQVYAHLLSDSQLDDAPAVFDPAPVTETLRETLRRRRRLATKPRRSQRESPLRSIPKPGLAGSNPAEGITKSLLTANSGRCQLPERHLDKLGLSGPHSALAKADDDGGQRLVSEPLGPS